MNINDILKKGQSDKIEQSGGTPETPDTAPRVAWIVIRSSVLNDCIIFLYRKEDLVEARAAHPDLAIYFYQEIEEILDKDIESIIEAHKWKREFKGWILPTPPRAEKEEANNG